MLPDLKEPSEEEERQTHRALFSLRNAVWKQAIAVPTLAIQAVPDVQPPVVTENERVQEAITETIVPEPASTRSPLLGWILAGSGLTLLTAGIVVAETQGRHLGNPNVSAAGKDAAR